MRFSIVAFLVASIASISNAAVIPRANVNAGLAARYYADGVYPRETFEEVSNVARENVVETSETRRIHSRDFHAKRAGAPEPEKSETHVKRAPRIVNRRVHPRDFRVGRVTV